MKCRYSPSLAKATVRVVRTLRGARCESLVNCKQRIVGGRTGAGAAEGAAVADAAARGHCLGCRGVAVADAALGYTVFRGRLATGVGFAGRSSVSLAVVEDEGPVVYQLSP